MLQRIGEVIAAADVGADQIRQRGLHDDAVGVGQQQTAADLGLCHGLIAPGRKLEFRRIACPYGGQDAQRLVLRENLPADLILETGGLIVHLGADADFHFMALRVQGAQSGEPRDRHQAERRQQNRGGAENCPRAAVGFDAIGWRSNELVSVIGVMALAMACCLRA